MIGLSMVMVSVVYAPFAVPNLGSEIAQSSAQSLIAVLVLGLVCSAAAFVLFFQLIKEVGPAKSSLITYVNTAVALFLGIVFLSEPITIGLLIGIPLITVGLVLAGGANNETEVSKV
jgi:drug/metabolite transporter (DMT)-like permease